MAATANKRNPQKICFFDWLVNEINSGKYKGLYWVDAAHTTFHISWKHNSRKDIVADDYMIFQAWAVVSKKYNEHLPDPSRWKTNFRCALKSTKRFQEVKSNDPDSHVYKIIPLNTAAPAANPPAATRNVNDHDSEQLFISPTSEEAQGFDHTTPPFQEIDVTFKTLSLENPVPGQNVNTPGNVSQCNGDTLAWVMQQANLNLDGIQPVSWAPAPGDHPVDVAHQQNSACAVPHVDQKGYHLLRNGIANETVQNIYYEEPSEWLTEITTNVNSQSAAILALQQAQQNCPATNQRNHLGDALGSSSCFIGDVFTDEEPVGDRVMLCNAASQCPMMEQNMCTLPVVSSAEQSPVGTAPLQSNTEAVPWGLEVSIYYRGRLRCELEVEESSCLFTYNNRHYAQALGNPQIIQFPSPELLPDQKQVKNTLTVLKDPGLLLYQKNDKLWAKRLGKPRIFWAFSRQLDNINQHPEFSMLQREVDMEIFNYERFCHEIQQFYNGQRCSSPDYTIYLCFGQRFSAAKPKESKLVLVKLVPKFCKYWHERALRKGASSLNSEIESLEFSNSLFDMMEYLANIYMQTDMGIIQGHLFNCTCQCGPNAVCSYTTFRSSEMNLLRGYSCHQEMAARYKMQFNC